MLRDGDYIRGLFYRRLKEEKPYGWVAQCVRGATEDPHQFVRSEAFSALSEAPPEEVVNLATFQFTSPYHYVRWRTARILRRKPLPLVLRALNQLIEHYPLDQDQLIDILEFLALTQSLAAQDVVLKILEKYRSLPKIKYKVAKTLGKIKGEKGIQFLLSLLNEDDINLRKVALRSLVELNYKSFNLKSSSKKELNSIIAGLRNVDSENKEALEQLLSILPMKQIISMIYSKNREENVAIVRLLSLLDKDHPLIKELKFCVDPFSVDPYTVFWLVRKEIIDKELILKLLDSVKDEERRVAILMGLVERRDKELMYTVLERGGFGTEIILKELLGEGGSFSFEREDRRMSWFNYLYKKGKLITTTTDEKLLLSEPKSNSAQWPFGLKGSPHNTPYRKYDFCVCAINFSYDINLGVLIRTAEGVGAKEFFILGVPFFNRTSAKGAENYIPIITFQDEEQFILHLRARGYYLVGVQQSNISVNGFEFQFPPKPAFIFGSEGEGIPLSLRKKIDCMVELPMFGYIDSLNVTNAASAILYLYLKEVNLKNKLSS